MTSDEVERFDKFLLDSFKEGQVCRELRLSKKQAEYIKQKYPKFSLINSSKDICEDGKMWYEVSVY